ncbi:MAG: spore cortex biosynthesis protein YabQ [Lachnospiraceae bacterium]|jgi:spore cortex biosynthesis protein YabQ|nr:spore cortex biosynthesis protein YabQ [Lachnospiraceae bacterium]
MDGLLREIQITLSSLVVGAWLMMCYDVLRVFRILIRHGSFWTGAEDFIYWLYAGVTTFLLLYQENDGGLRWYIIAGTFAGMVIYDRFFSRIYLKLLKKAVEWIRMKLHKIRFRNEEGSEINKAVTSTEKR